MRTFFCVSSVVSTDAKRISPDIRCFAKNMMNLIQKLSQLQTQTSDVLLHPVISKPKARNPEINKVNY